MRNIAGAALLLTGLLAISPHATAADGAICFSQVVIHNYPAPPPSSTYTITFPQPSNATKFQCNTNGAWFTFRQLSQAGWIINGVSTVGHSTTINTGTGAQIQKYKYMLTIQK